MDSAGLRLRFTCRTINSAFMEEVGYGFLGCEFFRKQLNQICLGKDG